MNLPLFYSSNCKAGLIFSTPFVIMGLGYCIRCCDGSLMLDHTKVENAYRIKTVVGGQDRISSKRCGIINEKFGFGGGYASV